ncbi:MAG: hypothetical protein KAI43_03555 [Candidatus Aureabacteria bacterium]|nr:hypothetical protein [Candidatus Auribacterota bacterium]
MQKFLKFDKKSNLIFIESYDEVRQCLFIIKKNLVLGNEVIVVVSSNNDLYRFITELNNKVFEKKIRLLFWSFPRNGKCNGGFGKKSFKHIQAIISEKRLLKKFYHNNLSNIVDAKVYFFTRYCNPYDYYFLKKLFKRNYLMLINVVDFKKYIYRYYPKNIWDIWRYCRLKFIYGAGMSLIQLPHGVYGYMPDGFIRRAVKKEIKVKEGERWLEGFSLDEFKVFNTQNFKIIYFDQPLVPKRVEKKEFKSKLNTIFHIILKYFKESDLGIKHHPEWKSDKSLFSVGNEIEDFIPAEFLYDINVKVYISFCSGAIVRIKKGIVISLLDLMAFRNEREKVELKERLIQRANSRILFPQTMADFENILKNI